MTDSKRGRRNAPAPKASGCPRRSRACEASRQRSRHTDSVEIPRMAKPSAFQSTNPHSPINSLRPPCAHLVAKHIARRFNATFRGVSRPRRNRISASLRFKQTEQSVPRDSHLHHADGLNIFDTPLGHQRKTQESLASKMCSNRPQHLGVVVKRL